MNHDYSHCLDYRPDICPPTCFRAEITADLIAHPCIASWSHFKGTDECDLYCRKKFEREDE